jgi:hypothetical protein
MRGSSRGFKDVFEARGRRDPVEPKGRGEPLTAQSAIQPDDWFRVTDAVSQRRLTPTGVDAGSAAPRSSDASEGGETEPSAIAVGVPHGEADGCGLGLVDSNACDPLVRALAAPVSSMVAVSLVPVALLDQIAVQWVRRLSAGGDGSQASVRLEFGRGALDGASVIISTDHGQLSVTVEAANGFDTDALAERLRRRLSAKGLAVETVD